MAAAASCPGPGEQRPAPGPRFLYENQDMSSPKAYVPQPWITNLLVNYEQPDASENILAGQVLRVLSDSTAPGQPEVPQDAVLQVSDGCYHIRVVITSEALQAEENAHIQLRLSSLVCRIIVLQKYTVCFQEEDRLEDCEFYLTAHQFIVLPMERQRVESSDGNQEPSVLQKIKELWLKSLAQKNVPSSEPSLSQLIDAMGQNQLEVLKENAEECLDLRMPKEATANKVPITKWEAERKKEQSENIFTVPADALVIPPEEEAVMCDTSKADTREATPGRSGDDETVTGDQSVISQASPRESTAFLESPEGSPDNPWNRVPPISLILNSSDEKASCHDFSPKTQQDVTADSNTPDFPEPCSQGSPGPSLQEELVPTSSPSLLCSYRRTSPAETGTARLTSATKRAHDSPCPAGAPQVSGGSRAPLPSLSPAFPVLTGSRLQSLPEGMPHREQADSSGTVLSPDSAKRSRACAKTQGRDGVGRDGASPQLRGQRRAQGAVGRDVGKTLKPTSSPRVKKSRRKKTQLQCYKEPSEEEEEEEEKEEVEEEQQEKEEEEEMEAAPGSSSRLEQHRAPQQYKRDKAVKRRHRVLSPRLCKQIRSFRISQAMLTWACMVLTDTEVDS